jgi:hypothetical protein
MHAENFAANHFDRIKSSNGYACQARSFSMCLSTKITLYHGPIADSHRWEFENATDSQDIVERLDQ